MVTKKCLYFMNVYNILKQSLYRKISFISENEKIYKKSLGDFKKFILIKKFKFVFFKISNDF